MSTPTRGTSRKTHCRRGHLYDEANTYIMKNGYRQCRECKRILIGKLRKTGDNPPVRRFIEFNGRTQTITEWSREIGVSRGALSHRLAEGWSIERALTTPTLGTMARHR